MYIFSLYLSLLAYENISVNKVNIDISENNFQEYRTNFQVQLLSDKLGITKKLVTNEIQSVHQLDELRNKNYVFKDDKSDRLITNRDLSYTYHSNVYNDKEVLGFLPYWSLSKYQDIDYSKFSSLAYFSLTTDETGAWIKEYKKDGVTYPDGGWTGFNSVSFSNMVALAHSKGVKVLLLVKNFDPYSIRRIVTNTENAGDRLINNIVNTVREKGLDGVNIDFEYIPKSGVANDTVTDDLRASFASWHDKLADRMHVEFPNSHVSTDVFGSSAIYYQIYDVKALGKTSLDYIVFMTYDYITTKCYEGKYMSPMSPLYGNQGYNISTHLLEAAKKASSEKVIMGIPYYGIDFQVKPIEKDKYNALVDYPNCDGTIETYGSIVKPEYDLYHNVNTIKWNNTEKATWYSYSINGKYRHGYYDDARSLGAKYGFVRSANLGGIAIWAVGYDNNAKELYDVIRDNFQKVPFYISFEYGVSNDKIQQILTSNGLTVISSVGNNTYIVNPGSNLSGTVMQKLKLLNEVVATRFDVDNSTRDLK